MKRVLIAVPCTHYCETDMLKALYNMTVPKDVATTLTFISGYSADEARNKLVKESLAGEYDYTLFIDSDIIVTENLLIKLLELDCDIATGWYPKKQAGPTIPDLHLLNKEANNYEPITDYEQLEIIEIDGCGFGCTLVKNELFSKVIQPNGRYFEYLYYQNGTTLSEDLCFCWRAKESGAKILTDISLRCGHIGKQIY